jgi:hypothetical protein
MNVFRRSAIRAGDAVAVVGAGLGLVALRSPRSPARGGGAAARDAPAARARWRRGGGPLLERGAARGARREAGDRLTS